MPDNKDDPEQLRSRAHTLRAEALRALDLAQRAVSPEVREGLNSLAANWLGRAPAARTPALGLASAPQVHKHAQPQQMQQSQVGPRPKPDGQDAS